MMANVTEVQAYLAKGERRDDFMPSTVPKHDSPLPTSNSVASPVAVEA